MKPKKETVIKAIEDSSGNLSTIALRLGVSWPTARKYVQSWEATRIAFESERERLLDVAENRLLHAVDKGDRWAVKFFLMTQGKSRGYTYETDHNVKATVMVNFGEASLKDV